MGWQGQGQRGSSWAGSGQGAWGWSGHEQQGSWGLRGCGVSTRGAPASKLLLRPLGGAPPLLPSAGQVWDPKAARPIPGTLLPGLAFLAEGLVYMAMYLGLTLNGWDLSHYLSDWYFAQPLYIK